MVSGKDKNSFILFHEGIMVLSSLWVLKEKIKVHKRVLTCDKAAWQQKWQVRQISSNKSLRGFGSMRFITNPSATEISEGREKVSAWSNRIHFNRRLRSIHSDSKEDGLHEALASWYCMNIWDIHFTRSSPQPSSNFQGILWLQRLGITRLEA